MTWPGRKLVIRIYNFVGFSMSDKFSGFCKGKKWAFSKDNLGWKVQFLPWKSFNIYASADMRKKIFEKFPLYRVAFWPLRARNIYWKLFLCENFILNCKTLHILKSFSMTQLSSKPADIYQQLGLLVHEGSLLAIILSNPQSMKNMKTGKTYRLPLIDI